MSACTRGHSHSSDDNFIVGWVLQDNQAELLVRCNHNLVLVASNPDECNRLISVQTCDGCLSLCVKLGNEGTILNRLVLGHGRANSNALLIYDHDAQNTHVRIDAVKGLFYFLRHF